MQTMLLQRRDPNLRAYYVWGPFLKTDSEYSARQGSQRFQAPNTVHFWTPTQKLAKELAPALRLAAGRVAWDVYLLYRKGLVWDAAPPRPTYWQHQLEIIQGEPLNLQVLETRLTEALRSNTPR